MRRFIFLVFISLFLMASTLFPGVGKAYISHYVTSGSEYCYVYLSNITDEEITVEITMYKRDGSVLYETGSGIFSGNNVASYDESPSSGASVKFTIDPNESGYFCIHSSSTVYVLQFKTGSFRIVLNI
jgi:hypothetical protein